MAIQASEKTQEKQETKIMKTGTRYINRGEGKIAYDDTGRGPLVVCVPGMGEMRGEYRFLTPRLLAVGYRVVTMDMRGHGESTARWRDMSMDAQGSDIVALVRHLDAGPALLVANSMGCAAAVCADAQAPDLIAGMVLTGPAVRDGGGMPTWAAKL